jgi:hypothetical protein
MPTATASTGAADPALAAALHHPYDLPADAPARYRRDGFIHLPEVFDPALLDHFAGPIAREVARHEHHYPPMAARTTYDKAFQQVVNLWTRDDDARALVFSRRLAGLAARLMGCANVRLYHDQALFKEPGGGGTPWHADQHYWPLSSARAVTAWIPLHDVPLPMGPLAFAAGSHRIDGRGRELEISDASDAWLGRTLADLPQVERAYAAGEVSFHGGWTFHRAGANTTDRMRRVMTVIYIDADMRVGTPANRNQERDLRAWFPGLAPGDHAASELNPVLSAD